MVIRPRTDADFDRCEQLARQVQRADGYPPYLPEDDLRAFVISSDALGAWVADVEDKVVGHVALHPRSSEVVMAYASQALGKAPEELGVVARLLVSPRCRSQGIGRDLLTTAAAGATERGLWPILDVVTQFEAAVRLYESSGWHRLGKVTLRLSQDSVLKEIVYSAPAKT
jgi:GNAT superfamily N-acetyltransferase